MYELADQLLSHLKAIWRYRWYAVVFAWIIALTGWTYVYLAPSRYEAYTRVYVDTQSMLRPLLSGLAVQLDLDQKVEMMSRTLINRPNLEKVIRMADLDIGLKTEGDRAQLLTSLANKLAIKSAGKESLFTISFVDKDPRLAKRVVESLLFLFVEGSRSNKRKDSDSARRFIDEQLEGYRKKLLATESDIMAFKRRHQGLLPGAELSYFGRLVESKDAVSQAELDLKEAENSRDSIRKQFASYSSSLSLPVDNNVDDGGTPETETETDARMRALQQKLDDLRLSYTEQHPDIVAIVPMIAQLKQRKVAEAKKLREQKEAEAKLRGSLPSAAQAKDVVYQQLTVSLTTAEANVAAMKTRVDEYRKRYAALKSAANAVPQVEAEYTQLTREYDGTKARYDELLKRRESAQMSGDIDETDAAMDFRVIDPPRVPLAPIGPSRLLQMTMVLLAALGGGLGTAWLISQMRPTIHDERGLREVSGLPVLGTVIMAWTDAQKKRRNWGLVAFLTSFASLLSAYVAIIVALVLTVSRV